MTDELARWCADRALALPVDDDTDEAGDATDATDALATWAAPIVAGARVVGLGVALGGTRELPALAGRVIDVLVREHGVRTVAIQAGESAATALDAVVRDGAGSDGDALEALGSWSWNTHEVLRVVRALAAHNAGLDPDERVAVIGVEASAPATAVRVVGAHLRAVAPDVLAPVAESLADLALGRADARGAAAVERVRAFLAEHPPADPQVTRHAGFLVRASELARAPGEGSRLMAEAVHAAAAQGPVVLWAHADHVVAGPTHDDTDGDTDGDTAGAMLRAEHGDAYRALVLSGGAGTMRAVRRRRLFGPARTPSTHRVPAPPAGSLEATLLGVGPRDQLLDLRGLPGSVTTTRRSVGDEVSADAPATATVPCVPGRELDAFAAVHTVHPCRAR